ncbi:MAG: response regulator [Desulfobacterales bacterium]|nr:MAG: response regulator [Desulfobacterales bacterium]
MTVDTILLVDDEPGIRKVLGIALTDTGYTVHTAENGREALRIFRAVKPPIVLTDIKMPDMDGIELLRIIKREDPDTEVIMFTGHGDMDLAIKSLKHEATDFVTKPINDEVLEIALKRARERIALRQKLREYTESLEKLVEEKARKLVEAERMAAVGQTVTELSHAIKNIANGLKGSIFVLRKGIELDNKKYLREGWEMVAGNVDKIKNLSLDLLNYGKYAATHFCLSDPNTPAQEAVNLMRAKAQELGIDLRTELGGDLKACGFDPEGLHRCLLNLVANALDACQDEAAAGRDKTVVVKTRATGDGGIEYQVSDNGCGMPQDVQSKLFQSFFSTKGTGGTGIGLMMTKKIIDQHDGRIEVQSKPGVGTTVSLRIPARQAPPDA